MQEDNLIEMVRGQLLGNLSHPKQTLDVCREVSNIEGDFCECGVAYGAMSALMTNFIIENNFNKFMHMADSFQGIPYPTENDSEFPNGLDLPKTGELKSSGVSASSLADVIDRFRSWKVSMDKVKIYEGWLEETLPNLVAGIDKLAFLRIDVDLYRPTLLCLKSLGPKVSKGGVILVHDLMPGCKKAIEEYKSTLDYSIDIKMQSDDGGFIWRV